MFLCADCGWCYYTHHTAHTSHAVRVNTSHCHRSMFMRCAGALLSRILFIRGADINNRFRSLVSSNGSRRAADAPSDMDTARSVWVYVSSFSGKTKQTEESCKDKTFYCFEYAIESQRHRRLHMRPRDMCDTRQMYANDVPCSFDPI